MNNIFIKGLSFSYDNNREIFHDLNVSFSGEKINVLMGASGCGKTTLAKLILGLKRYSGDIFIDELNINNIPTPKRNFAFVDQNIVLYPHMSVFQNIAYPIKNSYSSVEEIHRRVNDIAKTLKIDHCLSSKPSQISLGQAQRVAIARALIKKPEIIIFDEPFANLDESTKSDIIHELKRYFSANNCTVIFITHSVDDALMLGDQYYYLDNGEITFSGSQIEFLEFMKNE